MDNTLPLLLHRVKNCLPGLDGRVGAPDPDAIVVGADNRRQLQALRDHWQQAHPEAGPHYWSSRCWSLLVWQPVYLSVLSVHLGHLAPRLATLGQRATQGFISGFSLPEHQPHAGSETQLIQAACAEIRLVCERLFADLNAVQKVHAKLAGRLKADCVMAALLHTQQCHPGLDDEALERLGRRWLAALELPDASGLMRVPLSGGRQRLALHRKVCCQHFRRCDGELCSTCPKLSLEQRLTRLRQEFADAVSD
ncbi:siderophore ferric iron reductase [Paludibacterium paludis]|uniref:Siderophore ferric iron reductase n=1 Tax=Paludibacterium paludis TaxID=1225769 RepID=A0A918P523_9NEIS|nr:siderophore ferric iron reductase [Paludibacterium paludis]GGY20154.1 siderophore ferric iron reductase [Paludibacterium paludis]